MKRILNKKNIVKCSIVMIAILLIILIILLIINLNKIQKNKKAESVEVLKAQAQNNIQNIIDETNETIMQSENRKANIQDLKNELLKQGYVLDETTNEIQYDDNILVTVNDNLNIQMVEEPDIKVSYKVGAVSGKVAEATVTVEGNEIEKIICEDITITNTSQRNKIAFDRNLEEDKEYNVKVKILGDDRIRTYHLIYSTNPTIEIVKDELSTNIEEKNIEITYPNNENLINYYSLDDGNTWIQCEGNKQQLKVRVSDKYTISAKSIYKTEKTIHNERIFYKFALGESLLQVTDELIKQGGYYRISVNNVEHYAHTYLYNEDTVISESTTYGDAIDVATASENAKHTVIVKVIGNLSIETGKTVTTYGNAYGGPKGMLIYVKGELVNNGTITMTARGAKAEGQNVYLWRNKNIENSEYEFIPNEGAVGGTSVNSKAGNKGANGTDRKTGRRRLRRFYWNCIRKRRKRYILFRRSRRRRHKRKFRWSW